ncbi:MAG: hypothetical protein HZRFUVUK_000633 [Candidatus Fervidibacterota bacterium]
MLALRCPRCGTVVYEGHFTFPVCHICHENLRKCRYCRHYRGDGVKCAGAKEAPVVNGEDVRDCDWYVSTLTISPLRVMPRESAIACIMTSIILSIIVVVLSLLPQPRGSPTEATITCRGHVRKGELLVVTLVKPKAKEANPVRFHVTIPADVLSAFSIRSVSPPPKRSVEANGNITWTYDMEEVKGDSFVLRLTMQPAKEGSHNMRLEVVEEDTFGNIARREILSRQVVVTEEKRSIQQRLLFLATVDGVASGLNSMR